jgi:poly-gamma-glutamate synthesis protein (capsule biosynthesis protein)
MKILVAGDYYPRRRIEELLKKNDYSFFDEVKSYTSTSDYSIVNFEGCVAGTDDTPIDKCGPNLRCDKKAIEALKYAGFDAVTLANNHFYDYGDSSVVKTLQACEEYGIDHVGGGITLNDAQAVLYKKIGEKNLAVINICEKEFSIATNKHGGAAPLNLPTVYRAIQAAQNKADYILVLVHGGIEVYPYPTPRMKDVYRFFIDAGASAVVNHHQHCISGYEIYQGKPIFYGLGNFCFDWVTESVKWWQEGFMVALELNNEHVGFDMIPYMQFADEPKVSFDVSFDEFQSEIKQINNVINDDEMLENKLAEFVKMGDKLAFFEPYNSRVTRSLFKHHLLPSFFKHDKVKSLLNMVRCESHRDVLLTALTHTK